MKNVSYLYKNLPSPLTKRITWPQTTVFWLGNTATTSSCSTALLPPVTSPLGQPIPPIIESSIRVGSRALQKPRAYDWRDCRIGKTGARTAASMRYTLLPTCGEQQAQGTGVSQHRAAVCCWCQYHWHRGDTSALLSQWFHGELKPTRLPETLKAVPCCIYPKKAMEQLLKVNSLISNH